MINIGQGNKNRNINSKNNKTMKKTILTFAFALIATIGVETFAQQPQHNPECGRKSPQWSFGRYVPRS